MPKQLIIEKCPHHNNCYTIRMGDRYHDRLTWDEMIGSIAYATCPKGENPEWNDALFGMKTEAEWRACQWYRSCEDEQKEIENE